MEGKEKKTKEKKGNEKKKIKKNERLIIPKNSIDKFLKRALKEYTVVAPVEEDGVVLFKHITAPSEMTLEFSNTVLPAKTLFFPQTETLFTFSRGKSAGIRPPEHDGEIMMIGIRPCDAQSLSVLDQVFVDEYGDPYVPKRKNTLLIGLSCLTPAVNCFCTSVDGSPFSSEYFDVELTDIGESYFTEVVTDKGRDLIESMSDLFRPATEKDISKKEELEKKALSAIQRHMNTENVAERLEKMFESSYWRNIAMRCLGCAACTYVCPTCHCFDMQDETTLTEGARIRVWDSCMYPEYTVHASGYNPRPERMNRVRNRVYHKYNYYPKNCGVIACVGCGRCIDVCPVNIDIIEVVNGTAEVE